MTFNYWWHFTFDDIFNIWHLVIFDDILTFEFWSILIILGTPTPYWPKIPMFVHKTFIGSLAVKSKSLLHLNISYQSFYWLAARRAWSRSAIISSGLSSPTLTLIDIYYIMYNTLTLIDICICHWSCTSTVHCSVQCIKYMYIYTKRTSSFWPCFTL